MSLTAEARRMHNSYETAPGIVQDAVDDAYSAVREIFENAGFDVSNNDPAEELVAHIYKYLIDSAVPNTDTVRHFHQFPQEAA